MTLAELFEAARRKKPGSLKTDGTSGTTGHSIENTVENRVPLLSRCPVEVAGQPPPDAWRQGIATWPEERREAYEERAAIMEFDARLARADAEWLAYLDCRETLS